jgi:hypothetical protein
LEYTLKGINGIIRTIKVRNINSAISREEVVIFACLHLIWVHYILYYLYAKFQLITTRIYVFILEILQNFAKTRKGQKCIPMIGYFILHAITLILIQIT